MVISYLQLLEMRSGDMLAGEIRDYLNFAVDGAQRMNQLLEAILSFTKDAPLDVLSLSLRSEETLEV